jgi:hypothetical protein
VTFGNLVGSLFFAAILVKCEAWLLALLGFSYLTSRMKNQTDSGIISAAPYDTYVQEFALYVDC